MTERIAIIDHIAFYKEGVKEIQRVAESIGDEAEVEILPIEGVSDKALVTVKTLPSARIKFLVKLEELREGIGQK